jgi:hypothetical protein
MDKLYDLMTTGFKYQIVSCKSADELLQVNSKPKAKGRIVGRKPVDEFLRAKP